MDAESKELLREWLVRSLEPVCDADPEVLSKYVLALIQNDPKKEGLQETCITKLEEFLGDETTPFVMRLFAALDSESYRKEEGEDQAGQDSHGRHHHQHQHHQYDREDDNSDRYDNSRRRGRASSDDEDDHGRHSKRGRRDDEYSRDGGRRYNDSPRRGGDGRRDGYGGRDGGRGGAPGQRGPGGPRGADWDPRGYPAGDRRRNFPPEWGMPPPGMWPPHYPPPRGGFPPHPMGDFDPNVYNPENPGMMPPPHQMMMGPRHMGAPYYPYPGRGRGGRGGYHGGRGRGEDGVQGAAGNENGGGVAPAGAKTTLRVSNVDPKYVNMTKLSLHFSKFGNVVNVQMRPNHKCAYVQYATEEEAKKAFHSPYPVCNNRFIEVKWAKYDAKDPLGAPTEEADGTKEENDAANGESATEKSETGGDTDSTAESAAVPPTEMTQEELRAAALEKGRKVLEEKRELLEKQRQLMKQKEELLKRQLAQQKELLERMSQNPSTVSAADKRELLNKITALSEELKALQPRRDSGDAASKLSGLKAELSALEAAAATASGPFIGGRGRGRGAAGGRWGGASPSGGRGFFRGGRGGRGGGRVYSNTLDNRTTIVKVENLPEEARDPSVLEQHFGNFGGIERVVVDESAPSQGYIKFQDRYGGQAALTRGNMFGQAQLQLSWVEVNEAPPSLATTPHANGTEATTDGASENTVVPAST